MSDETPQSAAAAATPSSSVQDDPLVAYCQQCGRGLSAVSQRRIGAGIFCASCAAMRNGQAPGWQPVNAGTAAPVGPGARNSHTALQTAEPNPVLAGFLGLIPGVGAMYNGQYAKGVIHLVVFVVLVSLADNLNWVLWWFVWGWIFYQGFEAYHTAAARREGQPLPDPFGWNELGERLGFARNWSPAPAAQTQAAQGTAAPTQAAPYSSSTVGEFTTPPVPPGPSSYAQTGPDPYTAPQMGFSAVASPGTFSSGAASTTPPPPGDPSAARIPYAPTYTGSPAVPFSQPVVSSLSARFPLGAAWLIGLGTLFLLGNLVPNWHLDGRWLVPVLLAALALWLGGSRLVSLQETPGPSASASSSVRIASALLGPSLLLTVAVLLALQDASVLPLRHSWPVLLIVWGGLLLLQRAGDPLGRRATTANPIRPPADPAQATETLTR